jgi:prolyl-tRNA editing enzyme YbaK/EbsC (Cys-tRNA(Pro) deacylase)
MPAQLPAAVARTTKAFRKLGCHGDLIHISQDTVTEIAHTQRSNAPQTATAHTQMYEADGDPILVIVAGTRSLDEMSLASVLGVGKVTAVPDHVAANWTRQDAQAMAPVGHPAVLPAVIDVELSRHPYVWVPAGHPDYLFTTSYAELLRITAGTAAEIVERSDPDTAST